MRVTDDRMIGGYHNTLVAGAYLHDGKINSKNYAYANTYPFGAYPADAVPGAVPGAVKGALLSATIDRPKSDAVYVDDAIYLRPDLALTVGTQFEHAVRPRENLSNEAQSGSVTFNNVSPKAGLLWDVDHTSQVFANVSRSAEAPTYDVNANPSSSYTLKAQTATTYEVGTRGRRSEVTWDISVYRARVRNELQCISTYPGSCTFVNAAHTVHQGVEAGVAVEFLQSVFSDADRFSLDLVYTYNDFRFDGDPVYGNNRLAGVPVHLIRAEMLYKSGRGFFAGPGVEWMPKSYFVDNANTTSVDSYELLSFRVGFGELSAAGWSAYVQGSNLLDTRYISTVDVAGNANATAQIFYPGTGRSVRGGLQYSW